MKKYLLLFVLMALCLNAEAFVYEISEEKLQEMVSKAMPLTIKKLAYTAVITEPNVEISGEGGVVGLWAKMDIEFKNGRYSGRVFVNGKPEYVQDEHSVYLSKVLLKDIKVDNLDANKLAIVKLLVQLALTKHFILHPVYTIKSSSIKGSLAKLYLDSISVMNKKIILNMSIL